MQTWQVFEVLHYQKHPQDILFAEAENAELLKKEKWNPIQNQNSRHGGLYSWDKSISRYAATLLMLCVDILEIIDRKNVLRKCGHNS